MLEHPGRGQPQVAVVLDQQHAPATRPSRRLSAVTPGGRGITLPEAVYRATRIYRIVLPLPGGTGIRPVKSAPSSAHEEIQP
mgnify:CR=1 FL=1